MKYVIKFPLTMKPNLQKSACEVNVTNCRNSLNFVEL